MKKFAILGLALLSLTVSAKPKTIKIKVIETSDVHGSFFPYDYINLRPRQGSMARAASYIDSLRSVHGKNVILLDNGDILQGQPTSYYYNFVATKEKNIAAKVINYMRYDAEAVGNHDVETGHAIYDKWIGEVRCPMLGANIINTKTGKPYVKPYIILKRQGVKIAVIGMLTPTIPSWLNEQLWHGLKFDELVSSARYWVEKVKREERPDVVIGLFHSGLKGGISAYGVEENASERVAKEVPGFDIIMFGHDHTPYSNVLKNSQGGDVVMLNPANNVMRVAQADITLTFDGKRLKEKQIMGKLIDVRTRPISASFMKKFQADADSVNKFATRKIGNFANTISSEDCFFGSAAFTDLINDLQLQLTGADLSFTAPLSFNAKINKGDLHVSDLFNLYKFENKVYALNMTGQEIKDYLEYSYSLWTNVMKSADDHILLLDNSTRFNQEKLGFRYPTFNFDSALGIVYIVDVTKPQGQKITIKGFSNGKPFNLDATYKVAMNSYRGNGGGELLTRGAGIEKSKIADRICFQSEKDLRFYLMQMIERKGSLNPVAHNNWHFTPEAWTKGAIKRDRKLIFGD